MAIAACHAVAPRAEETDWVRVVALYDALVELTGSPVVELNRAVAVAMAYGPAEALALVDGLSEEPALRGYHLLPAVRGDLLVRLGRRAEARAELEQAAAQASNPRDRDLLQARAAACADGPGPSNQRTALARRTPRHASAGGGCGRSIAARVLHDSTGPRLVVDRRRTLFLPTVVRASA